MNHLIASRGQISIDHLRFDRLFIELLFRKVERELADLLCYALKMFLIPHERQGLLPILLSLLLEAELLDDVNKGIIANLDYY